METSPETTHTTQLLLETWQTVKAPVTLGDQLPLTTPVVQKANPITFTTSWDGHVAKYQ